jgi:Putative auto-transporter adhesin, head GIN domain
MKKVFFAIIGMLILFPSIAQNKVVNDPNAQIRSASGFHAIKVSTGIILILTQGSEEAVAVSASKPEERDRIKTVVENGVLKIYYDNNTWNYTTNNKKLRAYVSCKVLDALSVSSGAQVEVDGTIKSSDLSLHFSSGSGFKGDIAVTELKIDQGSGSTATISGTASSLKADAGSGSALHAFGLQADECDVNASSGAGIDISVLKLLKASAHSGGQVYYKGTGVISTISTGSGGSVSKK